MFGAVAKMGLTRLPRNALGDAFFSLAMFWRAHGRQPSRSSGLFNDYLYFLKISSELYSPLRQYTSDKYFVKNFIDSILGDRYTISTLGLYDLFDDIPFGNLKEPCVLKPSHSSGCVVFLPDHKAVPNTKTLGSEPMGPLAEPD